jgi:hypothetical protein
MIPKSFCFNKSRIKAFVLGADPTNFSKDNKRVELTYAFGIGQNPNYFRVILDNLNLLGIHLEDVYIQNLVPEYQEQETGKNKVFIEKAKESAKLIASEFNKVDPTKKIPVFLTAESIYKALITNKKNIFSAESIYNLNADVPIKASLNLLCRPLIPLFRHKKYSLSNWPGYVNRIEKIL